MTEEQLKSMTEQEIRRRFRCAPAYYLQAKLDKKRALEASPTAASEQEQPRRETAPELVRWRRVRAARPRPAPVTEPRRRAPAIPLVESLDPPPPLPGFEILDAALARYGSLDSAAGRPPEAHGELDPNPHAGLNGRLDPEPTQQAILEAALEDYANWPLRCAPEPEPARQPTSELERKLRLVLEADPELKRALALELELEPELDVVLHSEPGLERALDAETGYAAGNVTLADFGQRPPRTVPVVSVVMDRKRPNMVRVIGRSTRLAS